MNKAQLNIDPEMGNVVSEDFPKSSYMPSNNWYNDRPSKRNTRYSMLQNGQKSNMTKISNHYTHLIMKQMNIRET